MDRRPLERLIKFLEKLPENALDAAGETMLQQQEDLIKYNKEQLSKGEDSEGKKLEFSFKRTSPVGKAYTKAYERFKSKRGGQVDHVDLNLSGTFINSPTLEETGENKYAVVFHDNKYRYLSVMYTPDLAGVNLENLRLFASTVLTPALENKIQQQLNQL